MALILRKHWRPTVGGRIVHYVPGDELPDIHPKRDWLLRYGIAVEADDPTPDDGEDGGISPDDNTPDESEGQTPAEDDTPDEGSEDDVQDTDATEAKRPPKVAKLDVWQKYAKTQGINPKGLTKDELIARLS